MKEKVIKVSEELHKKLKIQKALLELSSIDELITLALEAYTKDK